MRHSITLALAVALLPSSAAMAQETDLDTALCHYSPEKNPDAQKVACRTAAERTPPDYVALLVTAINVYSDRDPSATLGFLQKGKQFFPDSLAIWNFEASIRITMVGLQPTRDSLLSRAHTGSDSARALFVLSRVTHGDTAAALLEETLASYPAYPPALRQEFQRYCISRCYDQAVGFYEPSHDVRIANANLGLKLVALSDSAWAPSDYATAADMADTLGNATLALDFARRAFAMAGEERTGLGSSESWLPRLAMGVSLVRRLQATGQSGEASVLSRSILSWPDSEYTQSDWFQVWQVAELRWKAGDHREVKEFIFGVAGRGAFEGSIGLLKLDGWLDEDTVPNLFSDSRISVWREFNTRFPGRCEGHLYLGLALRNEQRLEESRRSLAEAVGCNPRWAWAWSEYGGAYYLQGKLALAAAAWERGLVLDAKLFDLSGWSTAFNETVARIGRQAPMALPGSTSRSAAPTAKHRAVPASPRPVSSGSAFIINSRGQLLTNAHVVEGCTAVRAYVAGQPVPATITVQDRANDLAVLSTGRSSRQSAVFRDAPAETGEGAIAAGYPLRGLLADQLNVTTGNVSSLAGPGADSRLLQVTNAVAPGNSGGPLFDSSGHVIGMVSAKLDAVKAFQLSGDLSTNISFAINAQVIRTFLRVNGINASAASPAAPRATTVVADLAKQITVPVECMR